MKLLPPYFSARQIVYAECHTYANIFFVYAKNLSSLRICVRYSPIAYRSWNLLFVSVEKFFTRST